MDRSQLPLWWVSRDSVGCSSSLLLFEVFQVSDFKGLVVVVLDS